MPIFLGETEESLAKFSFDPERLVSESEFTRTYLVMSDYVSQPEYVIIGTTGVPARFSVIGDAVCIDHEVKSVNRVAKNPRTGTPAMLYEVVCKFSTVLNEEDIPAGGNPDLINPLEYRPKVSWKSRQEEVTRTKDLDGKFIETSAFEPLILTFAKIIPILTVKKYEPWPFPPLKIFEFVDHTNVTSFYGAPPETALMVDITSEEIVINGKLYTDVTYQIEFNMEVIEDPADIPEGYNLGDFRPNTQRPSLLNNGYQFMDFSTSPDTITLPITNLDVNGVPQRVNLKITGDKADPRDPPIYLEFRNKPRAEFNSLGLGPF